MNLSIHGKFNSGYNCCMKVDIKVGFLLVHKIQKIDYVNQIS